MLFNTVPCHDGSIGLDVVIEEGDNIVQNISDDKLDDATTDLMIARVPQVVLMSLMTVPQSDVSCAAAVEAAAVAAESSAMASGFDVV
eukprot:4414775-Amphidinium_carterae.1